jgi:integrase
MPKKKPITVAPNIYRRATYYEVRVFIGGATRYLTESFPLDTPVETMQTWQRDKLLQRDAYRRLDARTITNDTRGTLEADVLRVLPQIAGRTSFDADRSHLRAWRSVVVPRDPAQPHGAQVRFGELTRTGVTTEHVNLAIAAWRTPAVQRTARTIHVEAYTRPQPQGAIATIAAHDRPAPITSGQVVSIKTIRHRCRMLTELFHIVEGHVRVGHGPRARWFTAGGQVATTPIDAAKVPALERSLPIDVDVAIVLAVAQHLAHATLPRTPARPPRNPAAWATREQARQHDALQTYGRFLVLCATAQRPCQLQRAQRADVDFEARLWIVRSAKHEPAHSITLNDDMIAAFRLFDAAKAWGGYDTSQHGRKIHAAGWPAAVRPYNARHSCLIAALRAGVSLGDLQALAGHTSPETTRRFYAPFLVERQRIVSDQLAGRLSGAFGPQVVSGPEAPTAAPAGPTLRDGAAARPAAAPLALVPPARTRRGRQAR